MAADSRSRIFTGARARFTINGQQVAWASGVDVSEEITQEPVDVLDRFEPYEYAPTAYRVTMSARYFRVPNESLLKYGIFTRTANAPADLRTNILDQSEMEALIEDPRTGAQIGRLFRVKPMSRNLSIGPRAVVGENVTFTAIYHIADDGAAVQR